MRLISLQQAYNQWSADNGMGAPFDIHGSDDVSALSESWNNYTDSLAKDGELNSLQYHYAPAYDEPMPGDGSTWDSLSDDREFIVSQMVTFKAKRTETRPNAEEWSASASHWRCTLRTSRGRMTVPYSMGAAHAGQPDATDVLGCLLRDAEYASESFADWCDSLGLDSDSRKAERMWKACKRTAAALDRLFTASELEALRELYEDA